METRIEELSITKLGIPYAIGKITKRLPDGRVMIQLEQLLDENLKPRFIGTRIISSLDKARGLLNILLTTVFGFLYTKDNATGATYSTEVSVTTRIPVKLQPGKNEVYMEVTKEHGTVDPIHHIDGAFYNTIISPMYRTKPMPRDPEDLKKYDNFDAKINTKLHEYIVSMFQSEKYSEWIGGIEVTESVRPQQNIQLKSMLGD